MVFTSIIDIYYNGEGGDTMPNDIPKYIPVVDEVKKVTETVKNMCVDKMEEISNRPMPGCATPDLYKERIPGLRKTKTRKGRISKKKSEDK